MARSFRERLYHDLADGESPRERIPLLSKVIIIAILLSVIYGVLETEETFRSKLGVLAFGIELCFFLFFVLEFALRLYASSENLNYRGFSGKLKFCLRPWSIIDLLAILPFILAQGSTTGFVLRLARVLKILRLARLGRFSKAWDRLARAVAQRKEEFLIGLALAGFVLILSSTVVYLFEAESQPEEFGSIPRALWWSIATLTTVGYGDVTPITPIGKIFAGITALAGVGVVAIPTGIFAAACSEAMQKNK
ncbi:MAG: ion transporter [Opitutales bacterium]|nr:ion transporter [Opitutales bacterium]